MANERVKIRFLAKHIQTREQFEAIVSQAETRVQDAVWRTIRQDLRPDLKMTIPLERKPETEH